MSNPSLSSHYMPKLATLATAVVAISALGMSVVAISLLSHRHGGDPVVVHGEHAAANPQSMSLSRVNAILKEATQGQAVAYAVFPGPDGLTGALVGDANATAPDGQQRVVSWINQQGYVMTGSLISPSGANLTLGAIQAFGRRGVPVAQAGLGGNTPITPRGVPDAIADQGSTPSVAQAATQAGIVSVSDFPKGLSEIDQPAKSSGAPELTIFVDPNCVFCHVMWQNLSDASIAGKVRIRWVPVGILRQDSMGRAASLIQGGLRAMQSNESGFQGGSETGGAPISKDPAALRNAQDNTQKFIAWSQFNGLSPATPTLVWTAKNGKQHAVVGAQTPAWIRDELGVR